MFVQGKRFQHNQACQTRFFMIMVGKWREIFIDRFYGFNIMRFSFFFHNFFYLKARGIVLFLYHFDWQYLAAFNGFVSGVYNILTTQDRLSLTGLCFFVDTQGSFFLNFNEGEF